jgi:poly(3-hydroxybutyrate) depolymerase
MIASRGSIDAATHVPTCRAPAERGGFTDGAPRTWTDADGVTRQACVYVPPTASADARVPLVVFFHGAGGSADHLYEHTSLRRKAAGYDVGAGAAGFELLAIQGRNLHWPTVDSRDGPHFDVYHRDLASPSTNRDVAAADAFVDAEVATGRIDPARIYVMGWSNGGFFAQLYAIARHDVATPGGSRVAAAAVFSAADPFRSPRAADAGRCDQSPAPHTTVPIAIVSRACDIVACDDAQAARIPMQPGAVVGPWTVRARGELGDPNVVWRIINAFGNETTDCTYAPMCPIGAAFADHVRWPDGVADDSGIDHETFMLDFLRTHPLGS